MRPWCARWRRCNGWRARLFPLLLGKPSRYKCECRMPKLEVAVRARDLIRAGFGRPWGQTEQFQHNRQSFGTEEHLSERGKYGGIGGGFRDISVSRVREVAASGAHRRAVAGSWESRAEGAVTWAVTLGSGQLGSEFLRKGGVIAPTHCRPSTAKTPPFQMLVIHCPTAQLKPKNKTSTGVLAWAVDLGSDLGSDPFRAVSRGLRDPSLIHQAADSASFARSLPTPGR